MKLKISRIKPNATQFQHGLELFDVTPKPREKMNIWVLHKRFCPKPAEYRVLAKVGTNVPVAIQRLKAS